MQQNQPNAAQKNSSFENRRKEERHDVDLAGRLKRDDDWFSVRIADLSPSGALIFVSEKYSTGMEIVLEIMPFGEIPAKIAHAGKEFCGVQFTNPGQCRDQIRAWLGDPNNRLS